MTQPVSTDGIEFSLESTGRIALLLAVVALPSLFLAAVTLRMGIGQTLGESGSIFNLHRALEIDPRDPELHRRVGMYDMYLSDPPDINEALTHLHRATELSPRNALYWSNLGSACESAGDIACADAAFERLEKLAPMMLRYHWLVANYYLRSERSDEAIGEFRRLLELTSDPDYARRTFEVCLRALGDPEKIWSEILAHQKSPDLKLDFVDYLSGRDRFDDAYKIWTQTAASSGPFPFARIQDYLGLLLLHARFQEALNVWQELERLRVVIRPNGDEPGNLVFNGGFEAQPLNAGFDWHFADLPFLTLDFAGRNAYRGSRCMRVDFTVKRNELYQPVYQFIPVVPGQHYLLSAYVRSDSITSDTGPELRVFDPVHPENLDVSTETTVGTTPWHAISLTFRPPPDTRFVMLAVRRARSRSFPTEISGTFWVDAISVKPLNPETKTAKG